MPVDHYEILGVAPDVSPADLKRAFRALSLKYHPDRNPDDEKARDQFEQVLKSYRVLSNTSRRRAYDHRSRPERTIADFFRTSEGAYLVDEVLRPHAAAASVSGQDLVQIVPVPASVLEDGGVVLVTIRCPKSKEAMEIQLQVPEGRRIARLLRLGEPGVNGGKDGDLILHLIPKKP